MESDEIRAALRDADRAEAAPWIDYPPTPRWYPPATGVWAAALTLTVGALDGGARLAAICALVVVELCFFAWYIRYRRGVMPTGRAPRELRPTIGRFLLAIGLTVLAVAAASAASVWVGAAVALAAVTSVVARYERAYGEAAECARRRLG